MTTEEQHAEIGRVVSERADARKRYACLQSKSTRLARQLQEVAHLLLDGPPQGTVNNGSDGVFNIAAGTARSEFRLPPISEVTQLIAEINEVQAKIRRLDNQCRAYGISD